MISVNDIAKDIVRREGGYVNDPDDPGGATKFGVTIGTMRRLGLDLDGDNDVDAEDVKRLTEQQAISIFKTHYFQKPGISRLVKFSQCFSRRLLSGFINAVKTSPAQSYYHGVQNR